MAVPYSTYERNGIMTHIEQQQWRMLVEKYPVKSGESELEYA